MSAPDPLRVVVQVGHTHNVLALAFHPRGRILATGGADTSIRLWDLRTMREMNAWSAHAREMSVTGLAFAHGGRTVLSHAYSGPLRSWSLDGRLLREFGAGEAVGREIGVDAEGRRVATISLLGQVDIWDIESGSQELTMPVKHGHYLAIAFSPDGRRLAVVSDDLHVLDIDSGRTLLRVPLPPREGSGTSYASVAYSRGGTRLVACWTPANRALLFDAQSLTPLAEIEDVTSVVSLPSERFAMFGRDAVQIRDARGELCRVVWPTSVVGRDAPGPPPNQHPSVSRGIPSPDGTLMASPVRNTVYLWETKAGYEVTTLGWLRPDFRPNLARGPMVVSNPMYPMFAMSDRKHVRLWRLQHELAPRIIEESDVGVTRLAFHPGGGLLAMARGGQVRIRDLLRDRWTHSWSTETVTALAFRPFSSTLVTGHKDGALRLWNANKGTLSSHVESRGCDMFGIQDIAYAHDGQWLQLLAGRVPSLLETRDGATGISKNSTLPRIYSGIGLALNSEGVLAIARGGNNGKLLRDSHAMSIDVLLSSLRDEALYRLPHGAGAHSLCFSPDGAQLATGGDDGIVRVWRDPWDVPHELPEPLTASVTGVAYSSDARLLAAIDDEGIMRLWRRESGEYFATLVCTDDEHVCVLADGTYTASRDALHRVAFRSGARMIPFEQFDLSLNRPDRVLERLGYVLPSTSEYWRHACERRLQRHGLPASPPDVQRRLPELTATSNPDVAATRERRVTLDIEARSSDAPLIRLQAWVNGVPVHGAAGLELPDIEEHRCSLPLALAAGPNHIELSVLDANGSESLRESRRIECLDRTPGRLFVVSVGVSHYLDPMMTPLRYATKDARDIATMFETSGATYTSVESVVLLDDQVTREGIVGRSADPLEAATEDDTVVLFLAGHGVLDAESGFVFCTSDVDHRSVAERGLSFDELERTLMATRARKRLLLIDSCHSGEHEFGIDVSRARTQGSRDVRPPDEGPPDDEPSPRPETLVRLHELFADLRRDSGAVVIAAAASSAVALESHEWQNGALTAALLEGLGRRRADDDADGRIQISELRNYVLSRVPELTRGTQVPSIRRENIAFDWAIL